MIQTERRTVHCIACQAPLTFEYHTTSHPECPEFVATGNAFIGLIQNEDELAPVVKTVFLCSITCQRRFLTATLSKRFSMFQHLAIPLSSSPSSEPS